MAIIEDFGQKIGGARKDDWKFTGLSTHNLTEMTDLERSTYVKKDNIWLKPDWEALIADGTPQAVAYWQNKMRQAIPPKPPGASKEEQDNYVSVVSRIRDAVMDVQDQNEIRGFYRNFIIPEFTNGQNSGYFYSLNEEASGIITNKVLSAAQASYSKMEREAKEKLFGVPKGEREYTAVKQQLQIHKFAEGSVSLEPDPYEKETMRLTVHEGWRHIYYYLRAKDPYHNKEDWQPDTYFVMGSNRKPLRINFPTKEEAEAFVEAFSRGAQQAADIESASKDKSKDNDTSNRKKNFMPPQLAHVKYTGPNYRQGRKAVSQMFLQDLKFRGGEFGNWLNNDDRQASLDMGYDALQNLATLLKVRPEDISFNGHLAIAFGARGRGGASAGAAHYEALREVINLTKMHGAGCLAHEWGHALDHAIGKAAGIVGFASEQKKYNAQIPESFDKLMYNMRYKETVIPAEELRKDLEPQIRHARDNLKNWIASEKPRKLPEDLSKAWDDIEKRILEHPESFSGDEYWSSRRGGSVVTHPDVEALSQIAKFATNHVIPRNSKQQFALWAKEINRFNKQAAALKPSKRVVKTDYYTDSIAFDSAYSKMGHGYWQSECEMFARAFDCYISDKIKEAGYRSDYLSSNADSFIYKDGDRVIVAFPQGEERAVINQGFDKLFEDLKERGILHEAVIPEPVLEPEPDVNTRRSSKEQEPWPPKKERYEQLSLDEILFSAASRASQQSSGKADKSAEHSR